MIPLPKQNGHKSQGTVINITISCLIMFLVSCILLVLSVPPPSFTYFFLGVSGVSLVLLLFLNLGFALFCSKRRIKHITIASLVGLTFCVVFPLCVKWAGNREYQWFMRTGMQTYDTMVDNINRNKSHLTAWAGPLDDIAGRAHVYGRANADGSISIWFQGRANYLRAGYLYYSGNQLRLKPGETNGYFFEDNPNDHPYYHLTNNWYEF
jgi:amino acid transporter